MKYGYDGGEPDADDEVAAKTKAAKQVENQKHFQRQGLSERDAVLVSLKNAKKEKKDSVATPKMAHEDYPYGTRVHVEGPHVEKLGLHRMKVGDHMKLHAKAKLTSLSHSESEGDEGPQHRAELQITHMGVHGAKPDSAQDLDGEEQD